MTGSAGADDWPYLYRVGFAASRLVVARGSQITAKSAYVWSSRPAYSDASGAARIYLSAALGDGLVTIGEQERIFHVNDWPRAVQESSRDHT
ncbi:MAG: hypothetical protein AAGF94_09565 [Pseudomonadota bacterium]